MMPRKAFSLYTQLQFWHNGTAEQRRRVGVALFAATERAGRNKALLHRHPDLEARYVKVMGLERIDQWNGYVPPPQWSGPNGLMLETSPRRQTMVELLTIARDRETEAAS